ncbi:hypothetical protein B0H13DRAFT_1924964 [Mycena leptocephala]|nr:hypothetical protein B0H13DRAFT_1924964 [Mycena leptocephala]
MIKGRRTWRSKGQGIIAAWKPDRKADPIHDLEHGYCLARNAPSRWAGNAETVFVLQLEGFSAHQEKPLVSKNQPRTQHPKRHSRSGGEPAGPNGEILRHSGMDEINHGSKAELEEFGPRLVWRTIGPQGKYAKPQDLNGAASDPTFSTPSAIRGVRTRGKPFQRNIANAYLPSSPSSGLYRRSLLRTSDGGNVSRKKGDLACFVEGENPVPLQFGR